MFGLQDFGADGILRVALLEPLSSLGLFSRSFLHGERAEEEAGHCGPDVVGKAGFAA